MGLRTWIFWPVQVKTVSELVGSIRLSACSHPFLLDTDFEEYYAALKGEIKLQKCQRGLASRIGCCWLR
jgi:hypothetical protein